MKNRIFSDWNTMRVVRLVIAIVIGAIALFQNNHILLWLSGLLFLQAILNLSCCSCGAGSCSTNGKKVGPLYKDQINIRK